MNLVTINHIIYINVPVDNGNLAKVMDFVAEEVDEDASVDYILFEVDAKIESEALTS